MQAHKVTLTIVDLDGLGADEIKTVIENTHYPNRCISPDVVEIETADIGEWSDDHPLNNNKTAAVEWKRLFPSAIEKVLKSNRTFRLVSIGWLEKKLGWATDVEQWEVWSMEKSKRGPTWHYKGDDLEEALKELDK